MHGFRGPRSFAALPLAASLAFAAGCAKDVTAPEPAALAEAPVEMARSAYTFERTEAGWVGEIDFAYRNLSSDTLSLLNCRGGFDVRLERKVGDDWVGAWRPVLLMCLSPPIRIPPGEASEHVLHVFAGHPGGNVGPRLQVDDVAGWYRLVILGAFWRYDHSGPPWGVLPPPALRVSAPFEILVEE